LPRTVEAYETIDLLVLGSGVLGRLDDRQREALGLYVANCGRIVLDDLATAELASFPERTSCLTGDGSSGVTDTLRPLPGPDELRELANESSGLRSLVFFFSGYLLVLGVLGTTRRRPVTMLGIPVLAALLLVVTGWRQPAEREFIFWAEFDSGARAGRYTALLDVRGKGPGKSESAVPVELGLPLNLVGGSPVEIEYRPLQPTNILTVHPRLLSRHQFAFTSAIEFVVPLTLKLREGKPWIENTSERPTPAAILAWQGRYFPVPPLESGRRWSPAVDSIPIAASEVPIVLQTRTFDRTAVLLGLAPEQVPAPDAEAVHAWLLLRPAIAERSS
jgi:hypothetical protein